MEKILIIHHTSQVEDGENFEEVQVYTSDEMDKPKFKFDRTVPLHVMSQFDAAVESIVYAEAVSARFGLEEVSAFSNVPYAAQAAFGGRG